MCQDQYERSQQYVDEKHWDFILQTQVLPGIEIVPAVWSMRCKHDLTMNEDTKYKAHLNLHGGKQSYSMNYLATYSLAVTWFSICSLILIAILLKWSFRQVDFVMAYMQAPIEMDIYMELPMGIETKQRSSKSHVLKLLSNLYG